MALEFGSLCVARFRITFHPLEVKEVYLPMEFLINEKGDPHLQWLDLYVPLTPNLPSITWPEPTLLTLTPNVPFFPCIRFVSNPVACSWV